MNFSAATTSQNESNHKQPNTDLSNDETAFVYNLLNEALAQSNIEISRTSSYEVSSITTTTRYEASSVTTTTRYEASSVTTTTRSYETNRSSFSDISSSTTLSSVVPADAGNNLIHSLKSR